jgi:hypothetical protein
MPYGTQPANSTRRMGRGFRSTWTGRCLKRNLLHPAGELAEGPMMGARRSENRWLWYSSKTSECVPSDRHAYPSTAYDDWRIPWPDWACKAPDGGVHGSSRVGQIDVHVSKAPSDRAEVTWTCDFQIRVISRRWLAELAASFWMGKNWRIGRPCTRSIRRPCSPPRAGQRPAQSATITTRRYMARCPSLNPRSLVAR